MQFTTDCLLARGVAKHAHLLKATLSQGGGPVCNIIFGKCRLEILPHMYKKKSARSRQLDIAEPASQERVITTCLHWLLVACYLVLQSRVAAAPAQEI